MSTYLLSGIGKKIREHRLELGLTVSEVADRAGVSKGLISKVENGRTVPSLPVLISIVKGLQVNMDQFFNGLHFDPPKLCIHMKADSYQKIEKEVESKGFDYHSIYSKSMQSNSVEFVMLSVEPNSQREKVITDAWEFKYLISGKVDYVVGDETYVLEAGDSILFDARVPHVPVNKYKERAVMLVIYFFEEDRED